MTINSKRNKKILFLITQLMGYQVSTIKSLINNYSAIIKIISWDDRKDIPYKVPELNNASFLKKSLFNFNSLKDFVNDYKPDLVVTSGWIEKDYNKICKYARSKNIITVAASDTQWKSNLKQLTASLISRFYHKQYFDYIWIAGARQYEYAKRLGFDINQILFNSLSADIGLFNDEYNNNFDNKLESYPKNILYVGRFSEEKGIRFLLKAFGDLQKTGFEWKLICVGSGPLKNEIIGNSQIEFIDYMQQEELPQVIKRAGAFILPSISESWGLVIQEFAAAGLPIICSDTCGAVTEFVINGYNGFIFKSEDEESIKSTFKKLNSISDEELISMGRNSHRLAQRITPETAAANLMSIF